MSDRAPFLRLHGVSKSFGKVQALQDVDLHVGADELLVVLGPTGAGKTTLLRTIAGLESPESGSVEMAGVDVTRQSPAARDVALVFQSFALYPGWTVRRNLEFPLKAPGRKLPATEMRQRVDSTAEMLHITGLLDRPSHQLSGGEMQRVAIGRALVRRPRIFMLDEPLTNLDAKLRESLRVELVELRRQLGTPMIFVTHDQDEALCMGDRIAVLSGGRVLQTGSPEQVYGQPVSPTVARQLGQPPINLLPVRNVTGHYVLPSGAPLVHAASDDPAEMLLGVRPEDVHLTGGSHPATVQVIEDLGPARILLLAWGDQEIHALAPRDSTAAVGDKVYPRVDAEKVLLWPAG